MTLLAWDDSFNVGIKAIDEQHKRLIKIINLLDSNYKAGNDKNVTYVIISQLREYTRYHFETEERLIDPYKDEYLLYEQHKGEHFEFINTTLDFFVSYASGQGEDVSEEILEYLVTWFKDHTTGTDRNLALFLKSKGVS